MRSNLRVALPLAVLALGGLGLLVLLATRPRVEPRPPARSVPVVRVVKVRFADHQYRVFTHGTVTARTESELVPEVSGRVVWISPSLVSGGFFEAGDPLLRIDPGDTEVALERARASVARRKSEFLRARKELERQEELAERNVASASRLDDADAAEQGAAAVLREARATRVQAERDLARTRIEAPWAGRVREEHVDVGQFVSRGAPVAMLYAIDWAEIRLPLADRELAWLDLPLLHRGGTAGGSEPEVLLHARFAGRRHTWKGRIVRTEGEIDPRSRMVHVVARVENPYGRGTSDGRPPLAVGLFVEAEILGRRVEDVAVLPRAAIRESGEVLVVDPESRLRFRQVEILRATGDRVVVGAGLAKGEHVCISPLDVVVDGMEVRVSVDPGEEPVGSGERS